MERVIINHDPVTADATVSFTHKGVSLEQSLNLKLIIPGSSYVLDQMGIAFDEEQQLKALDRYTDQIERHIEEGIITNPPVPDAVAYKAPSKAKPKSSGSK